MSESSNHASAADANTLVGIVVPAYKESDNIARLIGEIMTHLPEAEIIVVDDSPDLGTQQAVEQLKHPQVNVIHRTSKGGRGSAVLLGVEYLLKNGRRPIVEMDADFSHPPSQLPSFVRELKERQLDLLIGSRYVATSRIEKWPVKRRLFSKCANFAARTLLGVPVADYTAGFRAYSLPAAELIVRTCGRRGKGFISLSEILVNVYYHGMKVGETPTVLVNRTRGESSLNYIEIKNAFLGLINIALLRFELQRKQRQNGK